MCERGAVAPRVGQRGGAVLAPRSRAEALADDRRPSSPGRSRRRARSPARARPVMAMPIQARGRNAPSRSPERAMRRPADDDVARSHARGHAAVVGGDDSNGVREFRPCVDAFGSVVASPAATGCATASRPRTSLPNGTSAERSSPTRRGSCDAQAAAASAWRCASRVTQATTGGPVGVSTSRSPSASPHRLVGAVLRSYPRAIGACLAQPRRRRAGSGEQQRIRKIVTRPLRCAAARARAARRRV